MAKRMNNQSVIEAFISGDSNVQSHSGNLWVSADGKRLMNYGTCLLERNMELHVWIINRSSYSVTTSKIQSYIGSEICRKFGVEWKNENTITVENVPFNTTYLCNFAKEKMEWAKGIHTVKLINYFDVWGNKKDGWEINNMCEETTFDLHEEDFYNHKKILTKLKEVGFLKSTTRINQLIFDDLGEFGVEIYQKKDGMPICRVEFNQYANEVKA